MDGNKGKDNDRFKSLIRRSNEAGEKAFNSLIEFQNQIESETDDRGVAEALSIDASLDILVSVVASAVAVGKGIDRDEAEKIASKLRSKVRKVVKDFFLESGAKILTVDLEPGASKKEDEEEESEDR